MYFQQTDRENSYGAFVLWGTNLIVRFPGTKDQDREERGVH